MCDVGNAFFRAFSSYFLSNFHYCGHNLVLDMDLRLMLLNPICPLIELILFLGSKRPHYDS